MRTTFGGQGRRGRARAAARANMRTMIGLRGGRRCGARRRAGQTGIGGTQPAAPSAQYRPGGPTMAERISAQEARRDLQANSNALLVCAYDSDEKCRQYWLDGATTLTELQAREQTLPKDRELIFYCA